MRGLGHIPDLDEDVAEDLRERHVGSLVGSRVGALPNAVDYSGHLDWIQDQGPSNSCVGQALSTSVYVRAALTGILVSRPSAKAIYDVARLVDSPNVLVDDGCRPRAAILGAQEYGFVAEERWPLTASNVNVPPPLDVFRAGVGAMLAAYYRVGDGGVATLLRVALSKGFIPIFAMDVDQAYLDYGGADVYSALTGPRLGSHMQALLGYGPGYFLAANSWGSGWGAGGYVLIAPELFETRAVRDVLVPTVIPTKVL